MNVNDKIDEQVARWPRCGVLYSTKVQRVHTVIVVDMFNIIFEWCVTFIWSHLGIQTSNYCCAPQINMFYKFQMFAQKTRSNINNTSKDYTSVVYNNHECSLERHH